MKYLKRLLAWLEKLWIRGTTRPAKPKADPGKYNRWLDAFFPCRGHDGEDD